MKEKIVIAINHLQHIGIPVMDIYISEAFYNQLGFNNIMQSTFSMEGETGTCIMMKNNNAIIELYQLPDSKLDEIRKRKDGHIDHIAFDVDDIDIVFAQLKDLSYNIMEDAPIFLSGRTGADILI